eukprot:scaffold45735_cov51-Attheya_sp.AAC.1
MDDIPFQFLLLCFTHTTHCCFVVVFVVTVHADTMRIRIFHRQCCCRPPPPTLGPRTTLSLPLRGEMEDE